MKELEETGYWIELLIESGIIPEDRLSELLAEVNELTAILVTCVKNGKRKRDQRD